jgi:hypothetical protein
VKQSEAEDHIWQLREDPEYFAEELRDQREYRSECILDHLRRPHPHLGTPKFWDETLRIMIEQAYLEFWHSIPHIREIPKPSYKICLKIIGILDYQSMNYFPYLSANSQLLSTPHLLSNHRASRAV